MRRTSLPLLGSALVVVVAACGDNETPPPEKNAYASAEPEPLPCVPNLDGKIEARELSPQLGVTATYLVSPAGTERAVDLVGTERDGKRSWSLGLDFADDQVARIAAQKLEGKWYAAEFAGLTDAFVTPIDAGGLTEGVYTHDESAFSLHGVASASPDGPNKTLLKYDRPIALYRFPLAPGVTYSTTGEVRNGTFRGLPYAGRDTYEVRVDAAGELSLPDFTVTQALRVRTKVTISPAAGQVTTQRQTSFLFECLGELARATSKLDEPDEDFTTATELRRLGLAP
ncbi:MAG: hypothetical protein KF850_29825 [Labilithrix sp.]|nr:hypothetical protein [Labilithrix sp.]